MKAGVLLLLLTRQTSSAGLLPLLQKASRRPLATAQITTLKMDDIPEVDIDSEGKFKYILIKVEDKKDSSRVKHLVRGYSWAPYHGKLFDVLS